MVTTICYDLKSFNTRSTSTQTVRGERAFQSNTSFKIVRHLFRFAGERSSALLSFGFFGRPHENRTRTHTFRMTVK